MELQELHTFVAVVRNGSFSKAAEVLGYSQAAVTVQIKNLEEELNVRLFDRIGKKAALTNRGQIFYEKIVITLICLEDAKEAVIREEEMAGKLRIGTIDSLCSSVFPKLLNQFYLKYPKVRVSVITDTPKALLDMLNRNELDAVYLLDDKVDDARFIVASEKEAPVVFAASPQHPLADGAEHTIAELMEYPFVLTEKNASYRKVLDSQLRKRKITIEPDFQSNNTELLVSMFPNGEYVGFLPKYMMEKEIEEGRIAVIKAPDVTVTVWLQLLYHKEKWVTREMRAFFETLKC